MPNDPRVIKLFLRKMDHALLTSKQKTKLSKLIHTVELENQCVSSGIAVIKLMVNDKLHEIGYGQAFEINKYI